MVTRARHGLKLPPSELGRQLRQERIRRGLTLENVAVKLGIHYSQLSRIERGEFVFQAVGNVRKVCKFLSVPKDQSSDMTALCQRLAEAVVTPAQRQAVAALLDAFEEINRRS